MLRMQMNANNEKRINIAATTTASTNHRQTFTCINTNKIKIKNEISREN